MTYDEMVKHLREKAGAFDYQGWIETAIDYELAADAIEKLIEVIHNHDFLESLIKPRWIPATEQKPPLPENEDVCCVQVIGAVKGRKEAEPVLYSRAYRLRDGKRVRIERFVGDGGVLEVTHWMLMPEPPQPPKEET